MESDRLADAVEVVYAKPDVQRVVTLALTDGLTAGEAVRRSGLLEEFPEIGESELVLGLFGEHIAPERRLAAGDRVEICRPLQRDPREMRWELTARGEVMGGVRQPHDESPPGDDDGPPGGERG